MVNDISVLLFVILPLVGRSSVWDQSGLVLNDPLCLACGRGGTAHREESRSRGRGVQES